MNTFEIENEEVLAKLPIDNEQVEQTEEIVDEETADVLEDEDEDELEEVEDLDAEEGEDEA